MTLRVAPDLALPDDAATGTFGVLATKGAGKSNAAVVMAEEMYDAGIPFVAVDPKGDWYGIRSSADGKGPGLPIVVFGGRHGDVPLEPTAGALIADLVLGQRLSCVLDVSQFSKADTTRFLLAFGRRLFAHADDNSAEPLHLFLEEAHEYLPQVVKGDQAELVNVWQRIVKQGRFKGLGCTMISQRSSVLNKDVLELIDTLIVLRTIGPRSRKSIKDWVVDQDVDEGLLASLPGLADGEAWVWSPGALRILQRVTFRRRRTFDSGATPKVGQPRKAPATLADVDLAAIKEQMADTIEKAKADDARELRREIAELRQQLARVEAQGTPEPEIVVERVEVPVLDEALIIRLEEALSPTSGLLAQVQERLTWETTQRDEVIEFERRPRDRQDVPRTGESGGSARAVERQRPAQHPDSPARRQPRGAALQRAEESDLLDYDRDLLSVLAQSPRPRTKTQLAHLAGKSKRSSSVDKSLARLRAAGYIAGTTSALVITAAGMDALGDEIPDLPTGRALVDHHLSTRKPAEAALLRALLDRWPDAMPKDELALEAGHSPTSSSVDKALAELRALELIEGTGAALRAVDELGECWR